MSLSLRKLEVEAGSKARGKHGIRAYLNTGKLPSGRAWKREEAKVSELRLALIAQYGGASIRPDVLSLIESAVEGLMIQRLSSLYVKKAGIMRRDSLKRGDLALHSVLSGQFISYANLVRLNLEAAARLAGQKGPEPVQTIAEIIAEVDAEVDAEKASAGNLGLGARRKPRLGHPVAIFKAIRAKCPRKDKDERRTNERDGDRRGQEEPDGLPQGPGWRL